LEHVIWWVRRDMRLSDNAALLAAVQTGVPVVPLFILDPETESWGGAPRWRLGQALVALDAALRAAGSRLVLRRGRALDILQSLRPHAVHWTRAYDPAPKARDTEAKAVLRAAGIAAHSHPGFLLAEPWELSTKEGGFFRVYSPFWRALDARGVEAPLPTPAWFNPPKDWPDSDRLEDWHLGADLRAGKVVLARHAVVGEVEAMDRLHRFLSGPAQRYKERRDYPAENVTSGLSENLTFGEIGPRQIWHHALAAGAPEHFRKELAWRDFAWHLMFHTPHIATANWRPEWDSFPWRDGGQGLTRWQRGLTGVDIVDAGMRELYATGRMHNRVRMIVASYLTKHLLIHWRAGQTWFADCLTDWDPASNAMGWQWVAGSGPDAAPYFRIFNPETQADKFDPDRAYRRHWLHPSGRGSADFLEAAPKIWGLHPRISRPKPMISLQDGRARALDAWQHRHS
jgi:deoxyribodipyrimidine photo-lyase